MYVFYYVLFICLHFSIRACHPCAGAMPIFFVALQFKRMIPEGKPQWDEMTSLSGFHTTLTPNPEHIYTYRCQ